MTRWRRRLLLSDRENVDEDVAENALDVRAVSAGYGSSRVLDSVSLVVKPGQLVSLVGANGAGKTTLLRAVAGVIRPSAGEVRVHGVRTDRMPAYRLSRHGVSHVPQGRSLFSSMTVTENVRLGAYASAQVSRKDVADRVDEMFELFPSLNVKRSSRVSELSGGQQQMVAIARGLMSRPQLLLLDEPSMGLAPAIVETIVEAISRLRSRGIAVLLVEQAVDMALRDSDVTYVMRNGRIVLHDASEILRSRRETLTLAYFGGYTSPDSAGAGSNHR